MVGLQGLFIVGIHSGCRFWYFKAELVELELMTVCFALVWGITEEKCCILMLCHVYRAQNTFSLIHCHFRRGTDCVFIFKFSFAFILYENTWGMCGLLLTCCILSVPIKSITVFKRPVCEGENELGITNVPVAPGCL